MNFEQLPLGKTTDYPQQYCPELLCPIARLLNRQTLPCGDFYAYGEDLWTAYELSWLNPKGKPQVALAEFRVPANSAYLIESKSLKLYLNGFNQSQYQNAATVQALIQADLSAAAQAPVAVSLFTLAQAETTLAVQPSTGLCIDELDIELNQYQQPSVDLLLPAAGRAQERLYSHLLKSNCLVTGQPDWGSVFIDYAGQAIQHASLLAYIVSFRQHQEFHEHCVERLFSDLWQRFDLQYLRVEARYVRRGGLDINPVRCSQETTAVSRRLVRQ